MEKRRLGKSGMVASVIGLGTMTFGTQADKSESFKIMDRAVDAGVDFFDTAELYPIPSAKELAGRTESYIGEWMKSKPRESVLIATKVAGPAHGWFNPPVRHDKAAIDGFTIRRALEGSLKRLQSDYVDLYQVHWPDAGMRPLDAIATLDELVKEGKIRAYGLSNETCYGMMRWIHAADSAGLRRPDTIQNNYSLNNRRFEDELATACRGEGVSCLPYSPLAGGVLAGKYLNGERPDQARFSAYLDGPERLQEMAKRFVNEQSLRNTEALNQIASKAGIDPVSFAIAWSKQNDFVASTLIGVRSLAQLEAHLDAAEITLSDEVMAAVDALRADNPYPMG